MRYPPKKIEDYEEFFGKTFNNWTVLDAPIKTNAWGQILILGQCKCGNEKYVGLTHLRTMKAKNCTRCVKQKNLENKIECLNTKKHRVHKLLRIWRNMIWRCEKPFYKTHHGRGIKVCDRWLNSFENFLSDMGERPYDDYQIDRINNDGNYEPGNCRWVTRSENAKNTRRSKKYKDLNDVK